MFLQIHTLTSYPAALLNRDDAGLAKRIPFGNAERLRVSSQCLKRHWREALAGKLDLPTGIRSRLFFEREIYHRLIKEGGLEDAKARNLTETLLKGLIQGGQDQREPLRLNQPVLFGKPEANYLVALLKECADVNKDPVFELKERLRAEKKNFEALVRAAGYGNAFAGIEGALFGRFVTSDILARTDAAVHVAHAFSVHALDTDVDYFTVVDDLKGAGEDAGAAHAGDTELGAGIFYGYVAVDLPLLVSNFSGCERGLWREQPKETLEDVRKTLVALIEAIATVSPGAKLGSTAPYSRAAFVLLESGTSQPRTLANAYLQALELKGNALQHAVDRLGEHLSALDDMYGRAEQRFAASVCDTARLADTPRESLSRATDGMLAKVFEAD